MVKIYKRCYERGRMKRLDIEDLKNIKGGLSGWAIAGIVSGIVFIAGILNGISNPEKCNN